MRRGCSSRGSTKGAKRRAEPKLNPTHPSFHYPGNLPFPILVRDNGETMSKFEDLSINELKSKLVSAAKETAEAMAPMLFYLRKKIKAQGKVGQGFGAWVEENLGITRRTADRWANEWAIANKLKDPPKPASGQKSKGDRLGAIVDGERKEYFSLNLSLTPSEQEQVIMAWEVLGEEPATRLICDTLTAAARLQEPKTDTFKVGLGELQEVGVVSPKRPARSERVTYAEDGEAR